MIIDLFHIISKFIEKPKRLTVLEVGCGNGIKTYFISTLFKKYYAIDINEKRINQKS
jgi:ubiquinone/menaquinone biosynthesis C-methylase UbiE